MRFHTTLLSTSTIRCVKRWLSSSGFGLVALVAIPGNVDGGAAPSPTQTPAIGLQGSKAQSAGTTMRFTYDANDNVVTRTDATGAVTRYTYDVSNRLILTQYPDGESVARNYDKAGRLVRMVDPLGATTYEYDIHDRPTRITDVNGHTTRYEFGPRGLPTKIEYPDGSVVRYQSDTRGNMSSITDPSGTTRYSYDNVGRVSQRVMPSGVKSTFEYDELSQLKSARHVGTEGSHLLSYEYRYDATRNITRVVTTEGRNAPQPTEYSYNNRSQLVSAKLPNGEIVTYQYDRAGRPIVEQSTTRGTLRYTWSVNRLSQIASPTGLTTFRYDASSNLIERRELAGRVTTYKYDYENRLIEQRDGATSVFSKYDGAGLLMQRGSRSAMTKMVYGRLGSTLQLSGTIDANRRFVLMPIGHEPLGEIESGKLSKSYLADGQGNIVGGVDPQGRLLRRTQPDAFGFPRLAMTASSIGSARPGTGSAQSPGLTQLGGRNNSSVPYQPIQGVVVEPAVKYWDDLHDRTMQSVRANNYVWPALRATAYQTLAGIASTELGFEESVNKLLNPTARTYAKVGAVGQIAWEVGTSFLPAANIGAGKFGRAIKFGFGETNFGLSLPVIKSQAGMKWLYPGSREFPIVSKSFKISVNGVGHILDALDYGIEWPKTILEHAFGKQASVDRSATPPIGGISLGRAARLIGDLRDIRGASYEPETGRVILIGRKDDISLPRLDPAQLAVAIRTIYAGEEPSMSIEPCHPGREDGCMKVLYNGRFRHPDFPDSGWVEFDRNGRLQRAEQPSTFGTHAGFVLFESDRYLKTASIGRDNVDSTRPFSIAVPGYLSELQRLSAAKTRRPSKNDDGCLIRSAADRQRPSACHRLWFVPHDITARLSADRRTVTFDSVVIRLEARFSRFDGSGRMVDVPGRDPAVDAFVSHFNRSYGAFAGEKPELAELVQLAKVFALVRWMHDTGISIDMGWVDDYIVPVDPRTPFTTPRIHSTLGSHTLSGGVTFPHKNHYVIADKGADQLQIALRGAHTPRQSATWSVPGDRPGLIAVALNLAPAPVLGGFQTAVADADVPIGEGLRAGLTRRYSSVNPQLGRLGRGWTFVVPSLDFKRVPVPEKPNAFFTRAIITTDIGQLEFSQVSGGFFRSVNSGSEFPVLGLTSNDQFAPRAAESITPIPRPRGQPIPVEDNQGRRIRYSGFALFDGRGGVIAFDSLGRIAAERNARGERLSYTFTGDRLDAVLDTRGRGLRFGYDARGRLERLARSTGGTTRYSYDAAGNLAAVSDNANRRLATYSYDSLGRLTTIVGADGRLVVENRYDAIGRVMSSKSGSEPPVRMSFDDATNAVSVTAADGTTRRTQYDLDGRPINILDAQGNERSYRYDVRGRLVAAVDPKRGAITIAYDENGNLRELVAPNGARTRATSYNQLGKAGAVIDAIDRATFVDYDSLGRPVSVRNGFQSILTSTMKSIQYLKKDPMQTSYTYDAKGNVASVRDSMGVVTRFIRDTAGRVFRVEIDGDAGAQIVQVEYDLEGRVTGLKTRDGSLRYSYTGNHLTAVTSSRDGTTTFEYDTAGRVARLLTPLGELLAYSYDRMGHVAGIKSSFGYRFSYVYDVLGRPLSETLYETPSLVRR